MTKFENAGSLLIAAAGENDPRVRLALLKDHAALITLSELKVLFDKGMAQLAAGSNDTALTLFRTGEEWASAADRPLQRLDFLERISATLMQTGPRPEAIAAAERLAMAACALVERGQLDRIPYAINASGQAAELSALEGHPAHGLDILSEVRRVARSVRSSSAELCVLANCLILMLKYGEPVDWKMATDYGLEAYRLLTRPETPLREGEPPRPELSIFEDIFEKLTWHAYEDKQFNDALVLARAWALVAPRNPKAATELALSLMRSKNFREAEAVWRQLVEASPGDPSLHASLAGAIGPQGRIDDALEEIGRAIALAPEDLQFRRYRVDLKRAKGDSDGAIADLSELIALCDLRIQAETANPVAAQPPRAQTRIDFERNITPRNILDLSLVARAHLYSKQGASARALADLERMASESDPETASYAMRERSQIFTELHQAESAIAELQRAVARNPQDVDAILTLGAMQIDRGSDADAINALTPLSRHPAEATKVVDLLTIVVERSPGNQLARTVRGFAAEVAARPAIAEEDFTALLSRKPDDSLVLYRRGRVRLMQGSRPDDESWNNGLTARRIIDGVSDLARAVALGEPMEDCRYLLASVVDRMCTTHRFHTWFLGDTSTAITDIFSVFPGLRDALRQFLPVLNLANQDRYAEALDGWRSIQRAFVDLSMPVSACRIDMYLADTLMRTFDLQGSLTHLDRASRFLELLYAPMSKAFAADTEQRRRTESAAQGRPVAVVDAAFQHVTGVFDEEFLDRVDTLAIDLHGRIGNFPRMLELLARHPQLEETANPDTITAQSNIAARLRDANLPERALALADRLIAVATDPRDGPRLLNLRGSINVALGQHDAANVDLRAAIDAAKMVDQGFVPLIRFNLVRLLVTMQHFSEARTEIEEASGEIRDLTPLEQMVLRWLRAEIAAGLNDVGTAITEVKEALSLSDRTRGNLGASASRISWEGRLSGLYFLAIRIALQAENPALLFDFVEQTRARAYLDAVSTTVADTPVSAQEIVDDLRAAAQRREVLLQFDASLKRQGPAFVDPDLVRALATIAPELSVVQRMPSGVQMLSPTQIQSALDTVHNVIAKLEARLDAARDSANQSAIGTTLDCRAVAALLRTRAGQVPILMAQYFPLGDHICCLTLRSGEDVPILQLLEITSPDVAATVLEAPWGSGADAEQWSALLASIVQPIAERSAKDELVWIVPCGPLHQIPFHAAVVDGVPLVARNPICISPSASVGALCLARARRRYDKAIVFGDTTNDLAFARLESQHVAVRFHTRAEVGDEATEESFNAARARLGDTLDVVHLAAHGTFDADDPLDSGILMAGGSQPTLLTARDVVRDRLPVELVTLSACESGRTHVLAADEPVGLTRAFLSAGAASVLATLWLVNDLSTRLIVERFYDALLTPAKEDEAPWRKALALQAALGFVRGATVAELTQHADAVVVEHVRAMAAERQLAEHDAPFADARYWAAFVLIGAWT